MSEGEEVLSAYSTQTRTKRTSSRYRGKVTMVRVHRSMRRNCALVSDGYASWWNLMYDSQWTRGSSCSAVPAAAARAAMDSSSFSCIKRSSMGSIVFSMGRPSSARSATSSAARSDGRTRRSNCLDRLSLVRRESLSTWAEDDRALDRVEAFRPRANGAAFSFRSSHSGCSSAEVDVMVGECWIGWIVPVEAR